MWVEENCGKFTKCTAFSCLPLFDFSGISEEASEDLAFTKHYSTFNILNRIAFYPLKRVKLYGLCLILINVKCRMKKIKSTHVFCCMNNGPWWQDGERARETTAPSFYGILLDMWAGALERLLDVQLN